MKTGQDLLTAAARHIGESYVLGAKAPKALPGYKGPWDCAEFVAYINYQVANVLIGVRPFDPITADAYTGFYHADAEAGKLVKITVEAAAQSPGAMLLRVPGQGANGHIAFSDGKGGTVEAHSARRGVIRGVVSGRVWDYGMLLPYWVDYSQNKPVKVKPPKTTIYRLEVPYMYGAAVIRLQKALGVAADGYYGPETHAAVVGFQIKKGLVIDGMVGPETARELNVKL